MNAILAKHLVVDFNYMLLNYVIYSLRKRVDCLPFMTTTCFTGSHLIKSEHCKHMLPKYINWHSNMRKAMQSTIYIDLRHVIK